MKLYIKNMVCDRCKYVIRNILDELELNPESVSLGEIDLGNIELTDDQLQRFRQNIEPLGFELISDKKSRLIASIKQQVIALVRQPTATQKIKLSDYLGQQLHHDYSYLSNLFSSVEGVTIEQYFILQKIEKVKELLVYDELSLTRIAGELGYSSVAHLSRQFKKVTGQTPSQFRALRDSHQRKSLDKT